MTLYIIFNIVCVIPALCTHTYGTSLSLLFQNSEDEHEDNFTAAATTTVLSIVYR